MKSLDRPSSWSIGLTIFSMFFGAGNSIFPLYVGCMSQKFWFVAFSGLILTAVVMPILGIIAMLKSDGKPLHFFRRIGKGPGLMIALVVISLLGPLGSTPRCIALSYSTLVQNSALSMPLFALISCSLIFFCSMKKKYILPIFSYILTPILIISLLTIIIVGLFFSPSTSTALSQSNGHFYLGLSEGYKTMDLLAAFFFSSTVFLLLKKSKVSSENSRRLLLKGGLIAGVLLALVYGGFCFVAGMQAEALQGISQEHLLKKIAEILLGAKASVVVRTAMSVACLTTAIALITSFTDFLQQEIFKNRISYQKILAGALVITFCVAIFEFSTISKLLTPFLKVIYPGLILLTLVNCFSKSKEKIQVS